MKAGDLVYSHPNMPSTRGELTDFLCDAILAALGEYDTERLSNGHVADALFQFLDMTVTTDEQMNLLKMFLEEPDSE